MYTILQELYYGNIKPAIQPPMSTNKYRGIYKDYSNRYEALRYTLKECDPSLPLELDLMVEKLTSVYSLENENLFEIGFTLGCRLMLEVMEHDWT